MAEAPHGRAPPEHPQGWRAGWVHGGGPQINLMLDKVNIKHKFFKGMRITDKKTFDIVEMVLSGVINKKEKEVLIKGMQFHKLIKNSHPFFTSSKNKLGVKDIKKQIIANLKNHE